MGRHQKRRNKAKSTPRRASNEENGNEFVSNIVKWGNLKMEVYYAAQGLHDMQWNGGQLVQCETIEDKMQERLRWRTAAAKVLPASFRIGDDVGEDLRDQLESEINELLEKTNSSEDGPVINRLKFLPHAYQLAFDRGIIRKKPELAALHEWLKSQTQSGFISRQETVSMIPPVVLNTQPTDHVMDMCAAPGSKSAQLLEALGPDGLLLANDASSPRAYMLVHQLRRIMHNNPVAFVTACDAQFFPAVTQFDRILCDAPCTGDGTLRKNIGVWRHWRQTAALSMHALQVAIAWKGASQLLKVGGYMCYSTCSFNPVENEAVVAEILRRGNGALELVDFSLEGFQTRPGISKWHVFCEEKTSRETKNEKKKNNEKMQTRRREFDEREKECANVADESQPNHGQQQLDEKATVEEKIVSQDVPVDVKPQLPGEKEFRDFNPSSMGDDKLIQLAIETGLKHFSSFEEVPETLKKRARRSAFPPSEKEINDFHLERCIRCLPHDNDTGGFFVVLFKKNAPISSQERKVPALRETGPDLKRARLGDQLDENSNDADEDVEDLEPDELEELDEDNKPVRSSRSRRSEKEACQGKDDFVPVGDEILDPLIDWYGLADTFEKDLYMSRACSEKKMVYYISRPVKDLIDKGIQERVTVIGSGLKAFVRGNKDCTVQYRIAQEAVHFLAPHMTKRKVTAGIEDFAKCLTSKTTALSTFSESFCEQVRPLILGSFIVILEGYEDNHGEKMIATMWRCRGDNLDGLVSKIEIEALKSKLKSIAELSRK